MRGVLAAVPVAVIAVALPASTGSRNLRPCTGMFRNYQFSPTGHWVVYEAESARGGPLNCRRGHELVAVRMDGRGRKVLSREDYPTWAWSPVGDRLALTVGHPDSGSEPRLLNVNLRTGEVRVRATGSVGFRWSPNGRWIAVTRWHPPGRNELLTGRLGEPGLYTLAQDSGEYAWSPTGRWIAFTRGGAVVVSRPDGESQHTFWQAGYPQWAPDGRSLLFIRGQNPDFTIYVVRTADWNARLVTEGRSAAWSPNGHWITVERQQPDGVAIFVVHPDGSGLTELGRYSCARFRWSPDERWLELRHPCPAFHYTVYPDDEVVDIAHMRKWLLGIGSSVFDSKRPRLVFRQVQPSEALWVMNPDGSEATKIPTNGYFYGWSPQGREFLVEDDDEGISVVRDGLNPRLRPFAAGEWPTWSPGGRRIAYIQQQRVSCGQVLMIKNVRGGKARPLARCG